MTSYVIRGAQHLWRSSYHFRQHWAFKRVFIPVNARGPTLAAGSQLVYHFLARGALLGFHLRLDPPVVHPPRVVTVVTLAAFLLLILFTHGTLQLGLLLILVSPLWLYAFAKIPDLVMENRAYLTLPGIAFIAATAAEHWFWPVMGVACLYAGITVHRNRYWTTRIAFWQRASKESPDKIRPLINYAVALSRTDKIKLMKEVAGIDEAAEIYQSILAKDNHSREAGLAASNLALICISHHQKTGDQEWMRRACGILEEAQKRWPTHPRIHFHTGTLYMGFRAWEEAIKALTISIDNQGNFAAAYRERAKCWGHLGNAEKAIADAQAAEKIDGMKSNIQYVKAPEEEAVP